MGLTLIAMRLTLLGLTGDGRTEGRKEGRKHTEKYSIGLWENGNASQACKTYTCPVFLSHQFAELERNILVLILEN